MYLGDVQQTSQVYRQGAGAGAPHHGVDMWQLLLGMWRQRLLMALIVVLVTGAVFAWLMVTPSRYVAESRILLEAGESTFTSVDGQSPPSAFDRLAVQSEVEVMQSQDLALGIIDTLKLADRPDFAGIGEPGLVGRLLAKMGLKPDPSKINRQDRLLEAYYEMLTVATVKESRVVAISFKAKDAMLAASLSNQLAADYIASTRNAKVASTRQAIKWLSQQIADLRQKVIASEAAVERLRSRAGLLKGRTETLQAQELSELSSQIILAAAARSEAQARADSIRALLRKRGGISTAGDVLKSVLIQRLVEKKVQLQNQIADLSTTLLPSHPRMIRLGAEVGDLDRQIKREARKIADGLENQARIAGNRETSLRTSLERLKLRATSGIDNDVQLRALEREANSNRELLESLLKRHRDATARADLQAQPAGARIIAHAIAPSTPNSPRRLPIFALGFLASIVLAGLVAFLREILRMAHHSGHHHAPQPHAPQVMAPAPSAQPVQPPLGPVPSALSAAAVPRGGVEQMHVGFNATEKPRSYKFWQRRKGSGDTAAQPAANTLTPDFVVSLNGKGFDAGSFEAMAGELAGRHVHDGVKRIMVTAPDGFDAKVTVVTALGRYFADLGRKCVIVDADFHMPLLAGQYDFNQSVGLAELLLGERAFSDVLVGDPGSGVDLVLSGEMRRDALALFDDERMEIVLDALDYAYDVVLVLASEPHRQADAGALIGHMDLSVAVAEATAAGQGWMWDLGKFAEGIDGTVLTVGLKLTGGRLARTLARRRVHATAEPV